MIFKQFFEFYVSNSFQKHIREKSVNDRQREIHSEKGLRRRALMYRFISSCCCCCIGFTERDGLIKHIFAKKVYFLAVVYASNIMPFKDLYSIVLSFYM